MFHISVTELALVCGVLLLFIIVPVIVARSQARINQRLKNIEKRLDKKK
ncbi:MAG: hypothetical protein AB1649_20075 [Chloroflexota bacterium]